MNKPRQFSRKRAPAGFFLLSGAWNAGFLLFFWNLLFPALMDALQNNPLRSLFAALGHPKAAQTSFILALGGHLLYSLFFTPFYPEGKLRFRALPESFLCSGALFLVLYVLYLCLITYLIVSMISTLFSVFANNPPAFVIRFVPDGILSGSSYQKGTFTSRKL